MIFSRFKPTLFAAVFALVATGCSSGSDSAAGDSLLNRDLSLPPGSEQPPALTDARPVTPPPAAVTPPRPAATKAPPAARPPAATPPAKAAPPVVEAPTIGTIEAGSLIMAALNSRVCTSAKVGDTVMARTTETVRGSNGVSIPAGATVMMEVASAAAITDSTKGNLTFRVNRIQDGTREWRVVAVAVPVADLERTRTTKTSSDVQKVAGGAAAGAIIGQILGKDTKATVIGAAAGAAAGTAVAMATATYEGCALPTGVLKVTLNQPLIIPIG